MTKRYFLDTTIFLRYFLVDSRRSPACTQLLQMAEDGKILVATSSLVILELHATLAKIYGFNEVELNTISELVQSIRNIQLCETTDIKQALEWHRETELRLSSCLLATQIPAKAILVSYDTDFSLLQTLQRQTPESIIAPKN